MKVSDKTAYNLFLRSRDFGAGRELVLSKETRRNIFYLVIVGHIVFFGMPIALSYLQKFFIPKRQPMISVKLFEEPKAKLPPAIEKPKPEPPRPEPPKPEPPKPEPPKPEVKKPEPKPVKPVVKVPAERPKPKWKPVDPKEIKKSTEVVKADKPKPPAIDSSKLRDKLLKIQSQGTTTTVSGPVTTDPQPLDYYDRVSAYLYELWVQPSKMELKGGRPKVSVSISLDASGRVLSSSIKARSGVASMDSSVEELLKKLSSLPAPPSGAMSFEVSLEISE